MIAAAIYFLAFAPALSWIAQLNLGLLALRLPVDPVAEVLWTAYVVESWLAAALASVIPAVILGWAEPERCYWYGALIGLTVAVWVMAEPVVYLLWLGWEASYLWMVRVWELIGFMAVIPLWLLTMKR
ncbi:hypothetical protein CAL65_19990 [Alkalilimnicola ehrlichii]|uniref:Uncharacterized protein n=1 Tax=Alkalilimnicola ehrlichii TaxID=351052 RepID=A0A3E0WKB1_9GAMM|nr:hypothetical protein CAL65_19990 [Alkalilimnicola ehrlichii]